MNIRQFTPSTKTNSLIINHNAIIHIIPDFTFTSSDAIDKLNINFSNCYGIVIKPGILRLFNHTFDANNYYLETKSRKFENGALKILKAIPNNQNIGSDKYLFFDNTITSKATSYIYSVSSVQRSLDYLFSQLKKMFKYCKTILPQFENIVLFVIDENNLNPDNTILNVLNRLSVVKQNDNKPDNEFLVFDNMVLGASINNSDNLFYNLMYLDNKGNVKININNFNMLHKLVENAKESNNNINLATEPTSDTKSIEPEQLANVKKLAEPPSDTKKSTESNVKIEHIDINDPAITRAIRELNITDKVIQSQIMNNIKELAEKYNINKIDKNEVNSIVLKSINKIIYNTDEVDEKYKHNPKLLIHKLFTINTYGKNIEIPPSITPHLIEPKDAIHIDKVTGVYRKEYEFKHLIDDNIIRLFKILETQPEYPIKVVSIDKENINDNMNTLINYKVTLRNSKGAGYQGDYEVNLLVPKLVNQRYFKLNGHDYIMANQLFMKPITKTTHEQSRLLTNYAPITLEIVNLKYSLSDLNNIFSYVHSKYSKNIKTYNKGLLIFKTGETFDLNNEVLYQDDKESLICEYGEYYVVSEGKKDSLTLEGKNEYLFRKLLEILSKINPAEKLTKTSHHIPYIQIHIGGIKLPLIIYLIQQLGIINALIKLNIEYSIGDAPLHNDNISIQLDNDESLFIYPKSVKNNLIINGLQILNIKNVSSDKINDRTVFDNIISDKYGIKTTAMLDKISKYEIDTSTEDILKYYDMSTNLIDLITKELLDTLLNDDPNSLADLSIYRARQSEIIYNLMYKVIQAAHSTYVNEVNFGKEDAKLFFIEDYIVKALLASHEHTRGNSTLTLSTPFSPLVELKDDMKVIKTGPGGVPSDRQFKIQHRNIHETQYGNISANSTPESSNVGLITRHTLKPLIINNQGSYGIKDINATTNGWDYVSVDEANTPFINQIDSARAILATIHSSQATPIKNGEAPLVSTGINHILPQLASTKFCFTAKQNGKVIEKVDNKYLVVKYSDNTTETLNIFPRLSRTKRGSYIYMNMNSLNENDNFKKNQLLAWTDSFDGESYVNGKNIKIALMNYQGYSFEDAYSISENITNDFTVSLTKEIPVIIPKNSKIIKIKNKNEHTNVHEPLVIFTSSNQLNNYIEQNNLDFNDMSEEEINNIYSLFNNTATIRSIGGDIIDIKMYLNNKKDMDESVLKIYNKHIKEIKDAIKLFKAKSNNEDEFESLIDNIDTSQLKIGGHKNNGNEYEGLLIIFYIKYDKKLSIGDKLANRYGAKGIVSNIIPKDLTPKGEFTENIDIFLSPVSVFGRKNTAMLKEMYLGKIIYYLREKCSEYLKAGKNLNEIRKLIIDVYKYISSPEQLKIIKENINNIIDTRLKKLLINKEYKFNIIIEPFKDITYEQIQSAANVLQIPLEEHVFIPELNTWTKEKVPVGVTYIQSLEHYGKDYLSLRSTGKYKSITKQPVKGKKNIGGQSIGNLDVYAILAHDKPKILTELMTLRSDDFTNKYKVISDIVYKGYSELPEPSSSASYDLFGIFLNSIGIDVHS